MARVQGYVGLVGGFEVRRLELDSNLYNRQNS